MGYVVLWIVCGVFAAIIASSKGRSFWGWLILGFLFSILALLAVGFMPKVESEQKPSDTDSVPNERKCPYCAEMIKSEAVICRFCGHDVEPVSIEPQPNAEVEAKKEKLPSRCSAYK